MFSDIKVVLIQVIIALSVFLFANSIVFAAPSDDFVITVKTDNTGSSSDTQFEIPTTGSGYNYNVDCNNDGTDEATGVTGNYTCNYTSAGTYTIRIKDNTGHGTGFPRIYFYVRIGRTNDKSKLLSVNQWGTGHWTSMNYTFYRCNNLNSATAVDNGGGAVPDWATDAPDLSGVTDMSYMFYFATSFQQDIGNWDVSNVTDMSWMFYRATSFNGDISGWNVSNVTNMEAMFRNASSFNQNISGWNVSNVSSMRNMFYHATSFNQDIGSWDVLNVTDMYFMLSNSGMSTDNYDNTLIGWSSKVLQNNVQLDSSAHYCSSETQRQHIIDTYNWTINDAGKSCPPPIAPTNAPDMTNATDTGSSNTDDITSDTTPTFEVSCSATNDSITLYVDGVANATYTCTAVGTADVTANPALSEGNHNITYTETNQFGESGQSPALSITIDTTAPGNPTINTPTNGSPVSGTAEPGATVVLTTPSGSTCTATTDASGNYSCSLSPAPVNGETLTAVATDVAGNNSNPVTVNGGIVISTSTDTDNDGISDTDENGVAGGDGNGDGTPDMNQPNVMSLPAGAGGGYVTIEAPSSCAMSDVQTIAEPNNPADPNYDFPYGLVEFRLHCNSANVKIYYHGANSLTGYTYRKYGPTPPSFNAASWYTLQNVTYGTSNINGNTVAYAEFTLTDGELGDDTGADGVIVDQGGPGIPAATGANADSTPVPTMSEWGMILTGLFMLFASFVMIRRKKENE